MGLEKLILNIMLGICKPFLSRCRIQTNKVTFISLTMESLSGDFKKIVNELDNKNLDLHFNLVKFEKTLSGKFKYLLNCFVQLYEVYTSKVIILNDNNYVISRYKRKGVKVIQIWHACGAVKKFGNQIPREYEIKNYDFVVSCADEWKPIFAQAFGVKEQQVITCGLPRTDILCSKRSITKMREKMYQKYPQLQNKYVYLYAPTFRGNIVGGFRYEALPFDDIVKELPDNCMILYKMHPLLGDIHMGDNDKIINVNQVDLNSLYSISDCLISDYSSVIYDFSILHKKMIFYVPDIDEYKASIGLNVEYDKMPGDICTTITELTNSMKQQTSNYDKEISAFRETYMPTIDGKNAKRIAALICEQCNAV